jgi:hypothetical protein
MMRVRVLSEAANSGSHLKELGKRFRLSMDGRGAEAPGHHPPLAVLHHGDVLRLRGDVQQVVQLLVVDLQVRHLQRCLCPSILTRPILCSPICCWCQNPSERREYFIPTEPGTLPAPCTAHPSCS